MNKIELFVYNIVRRNPALKQYVRNIYQGFFDCFPIPQEFFKYKDFQYRENFFFGFHDISPFSIDETKVLSNHNTFDARMPQPNKDPLNIGYFSFNNGDIGEYHNLGISYAWNWHKGCRLQWIDNNTIIYNTAIDNNLRACIQDINGGTRIINYPIDSIYHNEQNIYATSFSYERLNRCMPGYGYSYKDNGVLTESAPKDTGLYLIDVRNNSAKMLVSLYDLSKYNKDANIYDYLHFVTHSEFSPNGRYISFLYRCSAINDANRHNLLTKVMIFDLQNENLITLPTENSGSHYIWADEQHILGSFILNGKNCHAIFNVSTGDYKIIASNILNSDGHQSLINSHTFVTDTYPDNRRMSRIYAVDILSEEVSLLTKVYSPKVFQTQDMNCHIACDLHPRISPSGKYICFDSARSGKRGLYIMRL